MSAWQMLTGDGKGKDQTMRWIKAIKLTWFSLKIIKIYNRHLAS